MVYENASKRTNYYNLERISSVITLMQPFEHSAKHNYLVPDIFGFSTEEDVSFTIHIELSNRGRMLLINDFPSTEAAITSTNDKNRHTLLAEVKSLLPVIRFVRGLPDEVKVLGDEYLISELNGSK